MCEHLTTAALALEVLVFGVILALPVALASAAVVILLRWRLPMFAAGWLTFAAVLLLGLFAARPVPLLGVNAGALGQSVGGHLGGHPCGRAEEGGWICGRPDAEFSSSVSYRVAVDRFGCWTGVFDRSPGGNVAKRRISGCVRLEDYVLG